MASSRGIFGKKRADFAYGTDIGLVVFLLKTGKKLVFYAPLGAHLPRSEFWHVFRRKAEKTVICQNLLRGLFFEMPFDKIRVTHHDMPCSRISNGYPMGDAEEMIFKIGNIRKVVTSGWR